MQKYEIEIYKHGEDFRIFHAYGVDHLVQMLDTINKYGNKVDLLFVYEVEPKRDLIQLFGVSDHDDQL